MRREPAPRTRRLARCILLAISSSGFSTLRVAVAVPGIELEDVVELALDADDERRTVTLDPATRHLSIHDDSSITYIAFDIAADQLPPSFLRTFAGAKKPVVYYGRSGKKKIKIDKRNAASIAKMIDLHEAIGRSQGP